MFTLYDWIIFGILLACMIGVIIFMIIENVEAKYKIIALIIEVVLIVAVVGGCAAYHTKTKSGKRSIKTWQSETSGGIDRTVTVYDINGEEVAKYTGRFDVEESSQEGVVKIKFDCNGKRHIIYAQTGAVLIDENEEDQEETD